MLKRHIATSALFAALSFGGLELTAFATDQSLLPAVAGEGSDAALTDKVETLLRTDFGLAGSQFRVTSKGGVVTLSGTVPDEHSLRRALDLASGVSGVREVRNALEIDASR